MSYTVAGLADRHLGVLTSLITLVGQAVGATSQPAFDAAVSQLREVDPTQIAGVRRGLGEDLLGRLQALREGRLGFEARADAAAIEARLSQFKGNLEYHVGGKVEIVPAKPLEGQAHLRSNYTPGVADACFAIEEDPELSFAYTGRANTVAWLSNGGATLGIGNVGPEAYRPVGEGKGNLCKKFGGINVVSLAAPISDPVKFAEWAALLECNFGLIGLEDIPAPGCFILEPKLQSLVNIPVFHDDQWGTAIVVLAGLMNAVAVLGLSESEVATLPVVVCGAGASAVTSLRMSSRALGFKNVTVVDSQGVIRTGRDDYRDGRMPEYKRALASTTDARTLAEAIKGAKIFLGLSTSPNCLTEGMLASMADDPIIFAMANPTPEVHPGLVRQVKRGAIVATGGPHSELPFVNIVNNGLAFPNLVRALLDARATRFEMDIGIALARALAMRARDLVPEVAKVAENKDPVFGRDWILPSYFDPELRFLIPPAVFGAAVASGASSIKNYDSRDYQRWLLRFWEQQQAA